MFGAQKLQNQIFCLTEERDFFQGKYLEQVSEIVSLKEDLRLVRREVSRLRGQVMSSDNSTNIVTTTPESKTSQEPTIEHNVESDDHSTGTEECSNSTLTDNSLDNDRAEERSDNDEDDEEAKSHENDIRQSAEKLLQWASYRSSVYRGKALEETFTTTSAPSPESEPDMIKLGEKENEREMLN